MTGGPARRRALGFLKLLVAVALLGWVASRLPWTDTLAHVADPEAAEEVERVPGTIEGGWRGERVGFVLEAGIDPPGDWPAQVRAALVAGGAVEVEARPLGGPGFEWRPGMPRVFLDLQGRGLWVAALGLFLGVFFGVTRWWRLLNIAGCATSWLRTLHLAFLGLFFNLVLPGLTGGDLPKALLAVRDHPERRADALATVVIDRGVGLWALLLIANAVLWTTPGFEVLRIPAGLTLLGMTVGLVVVLSPRPRRWIRLDRWVHRLPQGQRLQKLEQAALLYRDRPGELLLSLFLSFGNHLSVILAVWAIGDAFGDALDLRDYVGIVPVANVISSLPLSPGGWGVGEAVFGTLFERMGDAATIGVAVSITYRLCTVALGLLGGLFLLLPGAPEVDREELAAAAEEEA